MEELGPVVFGAVLACLSPLLRKRRGRSVIVLVACLGAGVAWSGAMGELRRHFGYALIDAAQVALAYVAVRWLVRRAAELRPRRALHTS